MKKLLLAILAVGSISAANAQKNSILVYGTLGLSTDKTEDGTTEVVQKDMNFFINPGVGYQFSNHSTVGIQGGFNTNTTKWEFDGTELGEDKMNSYSVGAFYRYTYSFNKTFSVFAHVNASYFGGTLTDSSSFETKVSGFMIDAFPALAINLHNGLALNFGCGGINYTNGAVKYPEISGVAIPDDKYSSFNLTFGQQFNVGISKNFACKSKGNHEPGDDLRRAEDAYDDDAPKKSKKRSDDDE